jgi:AraC-like DNA-binding protein
MTFVEFSTDLPAERTVEFSSAEEMEEAFNEFGIEQPMRQLGRGVFRSGLAATSTKHAEFYSDRYNRKISLHLESRHGNVGIIFPRTTSGDFLAAGENIGNEKLLVIPTGSEVDIVGPSLVGSDSIVISEKRYAELTQTLCPTIERPEVLTLFEGDNAQFLALRQAVTEIVAHPELDSNGETAANVVASVIAWIGDISGQHSPIEISGSMRRIHIAKIVQDYIESHYQDAVHIEDLCRVSAVGVRTLQRYFREYFDLPVSQYLKTVRLDSARRELVTANSSETTVTNIAMKHGCTHLGRFSVEFRERFGVSPHEVLDSRPGQK